MRPCPSPAHLVNRLRNLALTSPPQTALFYARLWHALVPPTPEDHECLHVLALCHLQVGNTYTALGYVRDLVDPISDRADHNLVHGQRSSQGCFACALIVGKCCDALGRYGEGKEVLERALKRSAPTSLPMLAPASTSATAYLMMASLSRKGKAPEQAVDAYARALGEDPWLWEAFTGLCDIGAPPTADGLFPNPPMTRPASQSSRPPVSPNPMPMPRSSASEIPGIPLRRQLSPLPNGGGGGGLFTPEVNGHVPALIRKGMMGNVAAAAWETPSTAGDTTFPTILPQATLSPPSRRHMPNIISGLIPSFPSTFRSNSNTPVATPLSSDSNQAKAPPPMKRPRGGHAGRAFETPQSHGLPHTGRDLKSIEPNGEETAPVRRSSRLKTTAPKAAARAPRETREKRSTRSRSATSVSSTSAATIEVSSPSSSDPSAATLTDDWLRDIIRRCARAYRSMSIFACQDVLTEVAKFPVDDFTWCIELAARALFEMANYTASRQSFERLRAIEPYTLQSMDYYSTVLWHLGDAPALSSLSQWLISIDKESPQAWIAAGNCISIQKNHDEAMRCFRRATQVDPACAYAWTLCGYEASEMEEYDRALAFHRTAIRTDSSHYNAWYGMGLVYLRMGKQKYAEHHFRRAAEINPTSPVLLCCIGMVLEDMDDVVSALSFYDEACRFAPDSLMPAYRRIRTLVTLQRLDEAIALLVPLARKAPDEANIQFLLGKCYLRQGMRKEATVCFTEARDLQPKLDGAIKVAMRGNEDSEEE